ncbi:hypothetical protein D0501_01795 [Leuconostoc holzapfelii]|uniref:Uncharacterized protein n=1 Tax=Leuconostoc holzapfelii TaxID=434464 RepID=A0ABT2NUG5_9LACO|nr:hypothetical protein [Leuconostoc holzapfelii]
MQARRRVKTGKKRTVKVRKGDDKGDKRTCKRGVKKGLTEGQKGGILVYVLTAAQKQGIT